MSAQRSATAAAAVAIAPAYLTPTASSVISRQYGKGNYHFKGQIAVKAGGADKASQSSAAEILIAMQRGYIVISSRLILGKSRGYLERVLG
jgi:hypothetical protein